MRGDSCFFDRSELQYNSNLGLYYSSDAVRQSVNRSDFSDYYTTISKSVIDQCFTGNLKIKVNWENPYNEKILSDT